MTPIDISHSEEIFTVSRLNREVRFLLESNFSIVWIEGEISNFMVPNSGHWYFSLKDALAQVKCAMFKPQNRKMGFIPQDGAHVLIKARVSLYEGRGDFQLLVEHMEEAGEGKLRQEFEALKKRLSAAGLFDEAHKKELPAIPKQIGVITSATGAAIRDILSVLKRRFPCAPVIIYPTIVQGETAAPAIVKAIQTANRRSECDVIILARGGGSLEDLWPFNEEIVARAIFQSAIPIISGIGHEIDFTIADFVADQRAPTPSAAAELIAPDKSELLAGLSQEKNRLLRCIKQHLHHAQQQLTWTTKHLAQLHPKRKLAERAQQLDLCEASLVRLQQKLLDQRQTQLHKLESTLLRLTPKHRIRELQHGLHLAQNTLQTKMNLSLQKTRDHFVFLATKLDTLSPLATLKRGYAIATTSKGEHILRKANEVKTGEKIKVKLMEGSLTCSVETAE